MNQQQITEIIQAVLAKLDQQAEPEQQAAPNQQAAPYQQAEPDHPSATKINSDDGVLADLGASSVRQWVGVQNPHKREVLEELLKATGARVAAGRVGTRLRTQSYLRFLADHARSKDTVLQEIPKTWIDQTGLLEVQSRACNKDEYLTRPDLGRRLSDESVQSILAQCKHDIDVQVIVSDGLSTEALTANFDEILPPLLKGLESAKLSVGTPFFVRYGRVKIEDQIGELLKAKVVILLIGERPGLGQSESLSCYMIYSPCVATTVEADRNCISNIHQAGTPPVEAAAVIIDLAQRMLKYQSSGINLNKINQK
ncbi:ethanolamine ammonia-lyase small subunit [Gammaproteobacteria bacterium]|nr:ethanolamine ammonia-lyase small subunit [Gammaproteobacteria bacterium]